MIQVPPFDPQAPVAVLGIGNTTIRIGTWQDQQVKTPLAVRTDDAAAFDEAFRAHAEALPKGRPAAVVIGSVVPAALTRVCRYVDDLLDQDALIVGRTIPLPLEVGVKDPKAIGVDRVCAAAAAYEKLQHGCVVIDFGTAVTVDLVDDGGVLVGGAILPGLRLQLRSLHEHTGQLPVVEPALPDLPYGRDTATAMQTGVCRGMAGAVRSLVEGYATRLNRWPQVVATGGDLALMAPCCDFLDSMVANLTLAGIGLAYSKHLASLGA